MAIPGSIGVPAAAVPPAGDLAQAVLSGSFSAVGPGDPFSVFGPFNAALWAQITTTLTVTAGSVAATLASATGLANGAAINSSVVPPGSTISGLSGTNFNIALPALTLWGLLLSNGQITGLPSTAWLLGATVTGPGLPTAGLTVASIPTAAIPPLSNVSAQPGVPGVVQLSGPATPSNPVGVPQPFRFQLAAAGLAAGVDTGAIFTGAGVTFNATVNLERSFDGGATWIVCNVGGSGTLAQYTGSAVTPVQLAFGEPERGGLYRWNCIAYTSGTIKWRMSCTAAAAMSLGLNQLS